MLPWQTRLAADNTKKKPGSLIDPAKEPPKEGVEKNNI
jgi:hypothetical protein